MSATFPTFHTSSPVPVKAVAEENISLSVVDDETTQLERSWSNLDAPKNLQRPPAIQEDVSDS